MNEVPVNELPVNETPVNELPVNETPVNETPINELPVNETPVNETPVNELPVNEIMAAERAGQRDADQPAAGERARDAERHRRLRDSVRLPQTATLGEAYAAHAIRTGVKLGDLRRADTAPLPNALDGIKLGDLNLLRDYGLTLRDLVDSFAHNTFTLGDYFLLVLRSPSAQQGLAWERLNIFESGLAAFATDGSTVRYQRDVRRGARPRRGERCRRRSTVAVTRPSGFLYEPGSRSSCPAGRMPAPRRSPIRPRASPRADGASSTWTVTTIVGNSYSICFTARPGIELGPQAASLDAKPAGGTERRATRSARINVGDTIEPNNDAGDRAARSSTTRSTSRI